MILQKTARTELNNPVSEENRAAVEINRLY